MCCHNKVVNVASDILSAYQFKAIGQLPYRGFVSFLDWGTECHLAAIAVILALEEYQNSIANTRRVRGCPCIYHVHAIWVYWSIVSYTLRQWRR